MLVWGFVFFVIAVVAAILGFGVAVVTFAAVIKLVFYIAVVLFLVSMISHLLRRRVTVRSCRLIVAQLLRRHDSGSKLRIEDRTMRILSADRNFLSVGRRRHGAAGRRGMEVRRRRYARLGAAERYAFRGLRRRRRCPAAAARRWAEFPQRTAVSRRIGRRSAGRRLQRFSRRLSGTGQYGFRGGTAIEATSTSALGGIPIGHPIGAWDTAMADGRATTAATPAILPYDYGYGYGSGYASPAYYSQPNVTVVYPSRKRKPAGNTVYVERATPVIREYDQYRPGSGPTLGRRVRLAYLPDRLPRPDDSRSHLVFGQRRHPALRHHAARGKAGAARKHRPRPHAPFEPRAPRHLPVAVSRPAPKFGSQSLRLPDTVRLGFRYPVALPVTR